MKRLYFRRPLLYSKLEISATKSNPYVQRTAAVGQIAEGDAVHACLCHALQAVEADAA